MDIWWALAFAALIFLIINRLVGDAFVRGFAIFPFGMNRGTTLPILPISQTWQYDSIPRIIHQTAPSDKSKWHPVWFKCQKSWQTHFPDHEYKLWTDEDLDEFIRTKYEWFYPMWKGYDSKIKRIDSARYFILYEYGGIYADMDYECMENFETQLPPGKVSIAESPVQANTISDEKYQNALMASPPKHPFWNHVIQFLARHANIHSVQWATGPIVISKAFEACDPSMVHGLSYKEYTKGNGWAKHHGTGVWLGPIGTFFLPILKIFTP